jgi:heat shock protein HtpX
VGAEGQIVRNRKLAARMVLVSVLTPVSALALMAVLVLAFSGWYRFALALGLVAGLVVTVSRMLRNPPDGRVLAESDDPELFAVMDRLCAISDMPRAELALSDQGQPNSWVLHLPKRDCAPRVDDDEQPRRCGGVRKPCRGALAYRNAGAVAL